MILMRPISLVGGTAFAVVAVTVIYRKLIQHWKKTVVESAEKMVKFWEPVGRISGLTIYPVKSCRGTEVSEGHCTVIGLSNGEQLRDRLTKPFAISSIIHPLISNITFA